MEHVVFFSAVDGSPAYRRTANLEDAVRVVEHLRNVEGVEDVHVYALEPVALSFRPYYRVEVGATAPAPQAQPAPPAAPAPAPAPPAQVAEQPVFEAVAVPPAAPFAEPVAAPFAEPVAVPVQAETQPQQPVAEPVPVSAVVGLGGDDPAANGRGARGLGFFTRQ